eukprot:757339-Hanusia_phi.AAC.1
MRKGRSQMYDRQQRKQPREGRGTRGARGWSWEGAGGGGGGSDLDDHERLKSAQRVEDDNSAITRLRCQPTASRSPTEAQDFSLGHPDRCVKVVSERGRRGAAAE